VRWAILLAALAGCGGEVSGAARGEELFHSTSISESDLNVFSCADCHATGEGNHPGGGRAGYRLAGAALRTQFWGDEYGTLRDAIEPCRVYFMKGDRVEPDELDAYYEREDMHALYEYLLEISPPGSDSGPYPFTVVEQVEDVPRGDAAAGEEVYARSCEGCHGVAHADADGSILRETVNLPEVAEGYPDDFPGVDPSLVVIEKVRHGRFFNIGGEMPLFSLEALSDEQLGDLLAYLEL
jgi:thiosulfate dehydrogenase